MSVFTCERTARKRYRCTRCGGRIEAGQRYTQYAIPPGHIDFGNEKWIRGRDHLSDADCYTDLRYQDEPEVTA